MEKYLEKLLLQIRCKKARPYIAEEIRGHIESQIEDNIADGMSYEEAEKNAVADMGDPVTVGISLDKIHKPQIAWKLLVIVGILSLLGILLQQSIFYQWVCAVRRKQKSLRFSYLLRDSPLSSVLLWLLYSEPRLWIC